jgi:hypothetical protein
MKHEAWFPGYSRWLLVGLGLLALSWLPLFGHQPDSETPVAPSRTALDSLCSRGGTPGLPIGLRGIFATSGTCNVCHGLDTNGVASVNALGEDVNVVDPWRSTMMGNSARDPFWRAKVRHEALVHPHRQMEIENFCTSCHAPLGHFSTLMAGLPAYSMGQMLSDPLGLDGVSCGACHQQQANGLRSRHSGQLVYDSTGRIFGPYGSPITEPMVNFFGLEPAFGSHIMRSESCAGCHTLITHTLDLSGNPTGSTFVEQATYHEWINSRYNVEQIQCQQCHMPSITDPVVLSSQQDTLPPRTPYGLHELVGANTFMLQLLRDNRETLGLTATAEQFNKTLAATLQMLQQNSLELVLEPRSADADTAVFSLQLSNLAGHKFPSGYPSRRAYVELLLTTEQGDTLFHSGREGADGDPYGMDRPYEPHHRMIRSEEQVQVYELVPGDVNGNFTTVLERAAYPLKDNRLPPQGFRTDHPAYDTTQIAGLALEDPDFNRSETGVEGSGSDRLLFHLPTRGYRGQVQVEARVWYQAVPARWLEEMFEWSSPPIEQFESMFTAADHSPVLVGQVRAEADWSLLGEPTLVSAPAWQVMPNPASGGLIRIESGALPQRLSVYDASGSLRLRATPDRLPFILQGPGATGTYLLVGQWPDGSTRVAKYFVP